MTSRSVGAIDVGGTKILAAVITDGTLATRIHRPTPQGSHGADPGAVATLAVLDDLVAAAPGRDRLPVVIGVPEYVTPEGSIVSSEVLDWSDGPPEHPRMVIRYESDVRCGGIGAYQELVRTSEAPRVLLYVSVGTGLSHTVLIDGQPLPGSHGAAIALGELRPDASGPTLESQCSGSGLAMTWTRQTGRSQTTADLFRAAAHDPVAGDIVTAAAKRLASAIDQCCHLIDPDTIALGGGLSARPSLYRTELLGHLRTHMAQRRFVANVRVVAHDAGLLGAALLATSLCPGRLT